jgi:hypothetical protein
MTDRLQQGLVPTEELEAWFKVREIAYRACGSQPLGFGRGKPQYLLHDYPAPADDETMGLFCEWHTEDFFDVDSGPHVAIGLRGPVVDDPHRGRGLAIGVLASRMPAADRPGSWVPLFKGCPDYPGGPSFFVEDFSRNDGNAPIPAWQLSPGRHLPTLQGSGVYRIDIHVSRDRAWAGVWQVMNTGQGERQYRFMDQVSCSDRAGDFSGTPGFELPEDRGRGNAFIGAGFTDPDNRSWVDNIYLAHWKTDGPTAQRGTGEKHG